MKGKIKRFLLVGIGVIVVGYVLLFFFKLFPERFKVTGMEAVLFQVAKKDTLTNCYELVEYNSERDSGDVVVGIRFKLEYVDLELEFLENHDSPDGYYGPVDTLKSLEVKVMANGSSQLITSSLADASEFREFYINGRSVYNHSGSLHCYLAQIFKSPLEFVNNYNNQVNVVFLDNFHFFKVSDDVKPLLAGKMNVVLLYTDGRTVTGEYKIK